jgi:hypothetical protein
MKPETGSGKRKAIRWAVPWLSRRQDVDSRLWRRGYINTDLLPGE